MELVGIKHNWFTEHAEGMFIWGVGIISVAITMYVVICS